MYDQPNLSYLTNKIKLVQYKVALAISGAIRGTSRETLYQKLGFKSLRDRRCLIRFCFYALIPPFQRSAQNKDCIYESFCRNACFKNYFLPYTMSAETYASLRIMFLNFIRRRGSSTYKIYDPLGIHEYNDTNCDYQIYQGF